MSVIREAIQEASDILLTNQLQADEQNAYQSSPLTAMHQISTSSSLPPPNCNTVPSVLQCNPSDPLNLTPTASTQSPALLLTIANNIHTSENQTAINQGANYRTQASNESSSGSRPPRIHYNTMPYAGYNWQSGAVSPGASLLYINPPPPASHGAITPPQSPLQHQYLKLFSEVMAENILHESLGKIKHLNNRRKHVSGATSLEQIEEEERKSPSGQTVVEGQQKEVAVCGVTLKKPQGSAFFNLLHQRFSGTL